LFRLFLQGFLCFIENGDQHCRLTKEPFSVMV
jgi:hypothetical protein